MLNYPIIFSHYKLYDFFISRDYVRVYTQGRNRYNDNDHLKHRDSICDESCGQCGGCYCAKCGFYINEVAAWPIMKWYWNPSQGEVFAQKDAQIYRPSKLSLVMTKKKKRNILVKQRYGENPTNWWLLQVENWHFIIGTVEIVLLLYILCLLYFCGY